jgi:hypothetical protein
MMQMGVGRSRRLGVLVLGLLAAISLGGCSAARNGLGTADGPCYVALPVATAAVHEQGNLLGVRLVSTTSLRPRSQVADAAAAVTAKQVCLVGYSGSFKESGVEHPAGRTSGHLAVVVVSYPGAQRFVTVLLRRVPIHFGHSHVFSR